MQKWKNLLDEITRSLLRGEWLILYGPRGIGKSKIVKNVHDFILTGYGDTHIPIILNLAKVRASSVTEVEKEVLTNISQNANVDYPHGIDFYECMMNLLSKVRKKIVLLLTDVDIVSKEGALHISKELNRLYYALLDEQYVWLTVMVSGGMRLNRLAFGKSSPFSHARNIRVDELDPEEATRWIRTMNPEISDNMIKIFYEETGGYPELIEELVKSISGNLSEQSAEYIVNNYIEKTTNKKGEINSSLIYYWFSRINRPEFLFIIQKLLNDEPVTLRFSRLSKEIVELSGFLRINENYVEFRNPLIKKFTKLYAIPKRIADHFWIFSSRIDGCWEEGCKIYNSLSDRERERKPKEIIGPVYRRLSDLITACGIFLNRKDSEEEILAAVDNILEYLFNCQNYFVCKKNHLEENFTICFIPKNSEFTLGNRVDDPERLGLIEKSLREKREWAQSWNYSYIAFPLIKGPEKEMVLWIDNRSGVITKEHDRDILALASNIGLAILQLEQKEHFQNQLNLLQVALEHDEDYVQVVDMDRHILMLNRKSEENAKKWHPNIKSFVNQKCPLIFLDSECPEQCACDAVFREKKAQRHPESWHDPDNGTEIRYMDVSAVPFKKDGQMVGVLQIARDVTLLRRAMEAMIDFSSARTEDEVYSTLLKSISRQGAKRVRLYLPSEVWEVDKEVVGILISKKCVGYEDDPKFVKKFENGEIKLDGKIEKYWYDAAKKSRKPIISRLNERLKEPEVAVENRSVMIFEVPPGSDSCRIQVKKKDVKEWICMGLFAGGKFFGMVSVDKGVGVEKFSIIECDRMLGISRSAASAISRISIPDIRKVVRVFRHSIAQYLDAINQYIWTIAEEDVSKEKRYSFAKLLDDEFQRFELFSRNMSVLLPEMGKMPIFPKRLDIPMILNNIKSLFHYYCNRIGILLDVNYKTNSLPSINSDEMVVRIILYNLLDNAFKSLEKWPHEKKISIQCEGKTSSITISVIDTGPGVLPKDRAHIFDPGFSRKEGRTGIGLPSSKIVAEWINAKVKYDWGYENGTKFDLVLKNIKE